MFPGIHVFSCILILKVRYIRQHDSNGALCHYLYKNELQALRSFYMAPEDGEHWLNFSMTSSRPPGPRISEQLIYSTIKSPIFQLVLRKPDFLGAVIV